MTEWDWRQEGHNESEKGDDQANKSDDSNNDDANGDDAKTDDAAIDHFSGTGPATDVEFIKLKHVHHCAENAHPTPDTNTPLD